jgi:hypothetical protein
LAAAYAVEDHYGTDELPPLPRWSAELGGRSGNQATVEVLLALFVDATTFFDGSFPLTSIHLHKAI